MSPRHSSNILIGLSASAAAACWFYYNNHYRCRGDDVEKDQHDDIKPPAESSKPHDPHVSTASPEPWQPVREIVIRNNNNNNGDDDMEDAQEQYHSNSSSTRPVVPPRILKRGTVTIVYASVTGTNARLAQELHQQIMDEATASTATALKDPRSKKNHLPLLSPSAVHLASVEDYDWWDELLNDENNDDDNSNNNKWSAVKTPPTTATLIVLLPTYTQGAWPPAAVALQEALQELQNDWRIAKHPLKDKLRVAVFGTGSSEWDQTMGMPAKEAVQAFRKLGAKIVTRLRIGDDAVGNHCQETFAVWSNEVMRQLVPLTPKEKNNNNNSNKNNTAGDCGCESKGKKQGDACCNSSENPTEKEADETTGCCNSGMADSDDEAYESDESQGEPDVIDMEDMGDAVHEAAEQSMNNNTTEPREMVTPSQAKALKKEGYKLIGTHSAVKLCRWTKHQLRGRGGCYKHTFYGITSYQCMEATPSLACANKCVFCWRHHKNPVGKEWRWKTDDPKFIVDEAVKTHVQMIKETRGIPGLQLDRWREAHTVRHCALSLVGEPIMYPHINELLDELHKRQISTFLVTNGQHPAAIESLRPITQLYVSVDAPTQESLIAIDRPLFKDAWDRLKQSLSALKDRGQRTVARLTVVKGWNSDEISGYAELIALGKVSLVEVKGVTFCGTSDASNLNMTNTPWHHEVVELTRTLKEELANMRKMDGSIPEYDLACEHKHSCSVLLARVDHFAEDDPATGTRTWRTWIDYEKFQKLAAQHSVDPTCTFTVQDYTLPTPAWAYFGAPEEGFDPTDQRHRKKAKHPKYTQFDSEGVPTHDSDGLQISVVERKQLTGLMNDRKKQIGDGSTVTELKGGAKEILDASLMFRGMVVAK